MKERELDAAESLALIGRMIENTRDRMVRNAGRPYLVWGYTTVVFTLIVWAAVVQTGDPSWNWLWFGLPLTGGAVMYLTRPRNPEGSVRTFVDRVIDHVWMVVGLAAFFSATLSMTAMARPPMLFLIVLLMGIGTALTGLITRFKPSVIGGVPRHGDRPRAAGHPTDHTRRAGLHRGVRGDDDRPGPHPQLPVQPHPIRSWKRPKEPYSTNSRAFR